MQEEKRSFTSTPGIIIHRLPLEKLGPLKMATISSAPAVERYDDEKTDVPHISDNRIEHAEIVGDGVMPMVAKDKVDQFGGHVKVDPAEISLVRKLDLYMLVRSDPAKSCPLLCEIID